MLQLHTVAAAPLMVMPENQSILFTHPINLYDYADNYMLDKNGDVSEAK